MTTDLEFLDEVTAFLETETLVPGGVIPRRSFDVDGFQQLLSDESIPSWATISPPQDADRWTRDVEVESYKSNSGEGERPSAKKSKRRSETSDARRQKYRQKLKNERDELRQTAVELATQVRGLINAREGRSTTARTDLVLSESFWRKVATQQREQRHRVEQEHQRLLAIVNSQGSYIESLRMAVRECPKVCEELALVRASDNTGRSGGIHNEIDDLKWLRLKSSVSTLYSAYLHEANECYARVDQVFLDAGFASLPVGVVDPSYKYKPNGDVAYFQHRNRLLQPFAFNETCRVMWELATLSHRQSDRQVYHGVSDSNNTIGVQFQRQKISSGGATHSILKHIVAHRFVESDRVVIVWKIISEGEGIFGGMDVDETGWTSICSSEEGKTLMEFCSRQVPVPYLTACHGWGEECWSLKLESECRSRR